MDILFFFFFFLIFLYYIGVIRQHISNPIFMKNFIVLIFIFSIMSWPSTNVKKIEVRSANMPVDDWLKHSRNGFRCAILPQLRGSSFNLEFDCLAAVSEHVFKEQYLEQLKALSDPFDDILLFFQNTATYQHYMECESII